MSSHGPEPAALDRPVHRPGRKATWFELFFDLIFVVAVAQLSAGLAHHYDPAGASVFAFGFLALWWCWLGHTFHASRFEEADAHLRVLGAVQVLAVAWMAFGATDLAGARSWVFASGLAVFKLLLAIAYAACWRWRGARGLICDYVALYLVQAGLWGASAALPPGGALWACWGLALALDLASPWWVARHTHEVPPHPEHLPERFGLFTIILLGEGVAATVHALDHAGTLSPWALGVALAGCGLSLMIWLGYFERTQAQGEREVHNARAGRHLRLWAYAHLGLYLGVASLAAGTVYLAAHPQLPEGAAQVYAAGASLVMTALSVLGVASRGQQGAQAWRASGPHLALAGLYLVSLGWTGPWPGPALVAATCGVFALQLVLARRR